MTDASPLEHHPACAWGNHPWCPSTTCGGTRGGHTSLRKNGKGSYNKNLCACQALVLLLHRGGHAVAGPDHHVMASSLPRCFRSMGKDVDRPAAALERVLRDPRCGPTRCRSRVPAVVTPSPRGRQRPSERWYRPPILPWGHSQGSRTGWPRPPWGRRLCWRARAGSRAGPSRGGARHSSEMASTRIAMSRNGSQVVEGRRWWHGATPRRLESKR
jgi:hypothetical protein